MMMRPALRKLALTVHVTSSVAWLGAVGAFLALAITGLRSGDQQQVRGSYLSMSVITQFVILPLSLASPITGVVQSLGTSWGLFRHYWVTVKFIMTVPATAILLLRLGPISHMSHVASRVTIARGDLEDVRLKLVVSSAAAVVVLIVTTALSVYKPRGMTSYGQRKLQEERGAVRA